MCNLSTACTKSFSREGHSNLLKLLSMVASILCTTNPPANLEDDPVTFFRRQIQRILCHHLLSLSKGDIVEVVAVHCEAQLLPQRLHILQRVHTRGEHKEDRSTWTSLLVGFLKRNVPLLSVLGPQLLLNIEAGCTKIGQ